MLCLWVRVGGWVCSWMKEHTNGKQYSWQLTAERTVHTAMILAIPAGHKKHDVAVLVEDAVQARHAGEQLQPVRAVDCPESMLYLPEMVALLAGLLLGAAGDGGGVELLRAHHRLRGCELQGHQGAVLACANAASNIRSDCTPTYQQSVWALRKRPLAKAPSRCPAVAAASSSSARPRS